MDRMEGDGVHLREPERGEQVRKGGLVETSPSVLLTRVCVSKRKGNVLKYHWLMFTYVDLLKSTLSRTNMQDSQTI